MCLLWGKNSTVMQKNSCVKTFIMNYLSCLCSSKLTLEMVAGAEKCLGVSPPQVKIWEGCQIHPWNYTQSKGRDKFGRKGPSPSFVQEVAWGRYAHYSRRPTALLSDGAGASVADTKGLQNSRTKLNFTDSCMNIDEPPENRPPRHKNNLNPLKAEYKSTGTDRCPADANTTHGTDLSRMSILHPVLTDVLSR